jgi:hypothetical protein
MLVQNNDSFLDFDVLGHRRPRRLFSDRREPLCGDGAGHQTQAPPTRWREL